jgi:drug/metabolite transporter (DMT)-like permease
MSSSALAVPTALAAAACYATASALQHHEARRSSAGNTVAVGGMLTLARRPLWLAGGVADIAGLALHVLALGLGPVSLVQPLQVTGLLYALPIGGLLTHRRPTRGDLLAAAAVVAGLALFLGLAHPGSTDTTLSRRAAGLLAVVAVVGIGAGAWMGRPLAPPRRAVLLGALAGLGFAVGSVLIEDLSQRRSAAGWSAVVTGTGLVALIGLLAVGLLSLVLSQAAFQVGTLGQALPALTVTDPVLAVVLAALLLGETLSVSPGALGADLLAVLLVAAGVIRLAGTEAGVPDQARPGGSARPVTPGTTIGGRALAGAAVIGALYGLLPAVVAVAGMSRVDTDDGPAARLLIVLITVAVCALAGAGQRLWRAPGAR